MKNIFYLGVVFLLVSCKYESNENLKKLEQQAASIEIIRDDFGVAHVYGKTDADAVFGLLYAQCEDDFPRVERNFVWAIGRLAEWEGEDAIYSDVRTRLFMTHKEAKEIYSSAPDSLKQLCEAWADGINYYLQTHPAVKPKVITRFEPWMTLYFTEGSIGGDIERVSTKKIKGFYEGKEPVADLTIPEYEMEPKGSNGFAISGELTESGNAMLWINPHTTFYFRGEYHVISEQGLNAYGAITWGQFFIYQGFNEHTGWMHTSTFVDVIDEFTQEIIEKEGTLLYRYGEEYKELFIDTVSIDYLDEKGISNRKFPIYRTHHGPITHMVDDKWTATALMWEPVKALTQSFIRSKQKNHKAFRQMMDMKTNSSNNTVFADKEGNIAYYHGNFVPIRDTTFDYSIPVDGSNPKTDWKGLHDVDDIITVINPGNGWIQNCNSTPFTSAAEYSPKKENYPYYMATIPENFRGVHAIDLLSKLKQTKGLTLEKLIKLGYDPYLPAFEKVIPALIKAYEVNPIQSLEEPIGKLRIWDMKTSKESVGMTLAHFYGMNLYRNAKIPASLKGMERFNYFAALDPSVQLQIFSYAIEELEDKFGSWNMPWGEICRFQRLSGDMNASFDDSKKSDAVGLTTARWGALAAYGMRGKHDHVDKIYGTRGNSFVAAVEFGEKVRAKTILVGGQSNDPNSPHFDDQIKRYLNADFKEVAFYREDVEARAKKIYQPGKRK